MTCKATQVVNLYYSHEPKKAKSTMNAQTMNILMLAFRFPPSSSSGAFRPMYFAKYLKEMGENVFVLTARVEDYLPEQPRDDKLLEELDPGMEIFRTRVFRPREALLQFRDVLTKKKDFTKVTAPSNSQPQKGNSSSDPSLFQEFKNIVTDSLSTPDVHIGWLPSAVKKGLSLIRRKHIDIIYVTGAPWTSLLVGAVLKKITRKPLIMDFRDPWASNPSSRLDSTLMRKLEPSIERHVVAPADHIITNTEELRQDFLARYPGLLAADRVSTITNGFEDYIDSEFAPQPQRLTFTHAGTLYFSRNPRVLLQAILNVIEKAFIPQEELRFVFLGGIDVSIKDTKLGELLQHPLLQEVVEILPRLPYGEALKYQRRSDILLLIQPDFPLQIPRKLYEYMAFRTPIFGITNSPGATARLILEKKLGIVADNQVDEIESALLRFYQQWKSGQLTRLPKEISEEFSNKNLTLKLHSLCLRCLNKGAANAQ